MGQKIFLDDFKLTKSIAVNCVICQVQQVQEQMAKLKMQQHQPQVGQDSLLSDWPSSQPTEVSMAGQTMNNQLWQ